VKYAEFVEKVAERLNISLAQAENLTQATTQTLGERLTGGEGRDLAAQLPRELAAYVAKKREPAESFDLAEFVRRVGIRAAVPRELAERAVPAVFQTLYEAVSGGEFTDALAQLPGDFQALVPAATRRR
jgi:uncharacterized protein (DUF2267 family)